MSEPTKPQEKVSTPVDKRAKFVSLINARMNKLVKQFHQIQNLSNKNSYVYSEADVRTIMEVLYNLVEQTDLRFRGKYHLAESFDITRPTAVKP